MRRRLVCPKCQSRLTIPPGQSGRVKCADCGAVFPVPVIQSARSATDREKAVAIGVCVLAVIGLVISQQSVSLMTGSGIVWIGVALVGGALALAYFLGARTWVRVVAGIVLALTFFSACSTEHELELRRIQVRNTFNH